MMKAFKYRIYPTPEQAERIDKTIGVCRVIYNLALETKIRVYNDCGIVLSGFDLQKQFTQLRKEYKWIEEVGQEPPAEGIRHIDSAFKKFFTGSGYPKFKKKRNTGSFLVRNNEKKVDFNKRTITAGRVKDIKASLSRSFSGSIKRIIVSKTNTNKYFASILVKIDQYEVTPPPYKNGLGIDLGIADFATLSTGEKISNPRHLQGELKRLKVLQRRASRKKKGSQNRRKANLKVALLYENITNQRKDFLHKLSTRLISDNQTDTICVESLAVYNMVRNHKLAQAISDVSWSEFVRQLEYKGKWYGKNVIKIDKWFASSKTCSDCGHKKDELNLDERSWTCSNCGSNHDRDINAAINIRNSGMGNAGELVELSPIGEAMKQEKQSKHRKQNSFTPVNKK